MYGSWGLLVSLLLFSVFGAGANGGGIIINNNNNNNYGCGTCAFWPVIRIQIQKQHGMFGDPPSEGSHLVTISKHIVLP